MSDDLLVTVNKLNSVDTLSLMSAGGVRTLFRALVARVEQAEAEVERLRVELDIETKLHAKAADDDAALREQRCETCQHIRTHPEFSYDNYAYCLRVPMSCETLGHRCGAWARREP